MKLECLILTVCAVLLRQQGVSSVQPCHDVLDVVIVLDASGSVEKTNWVKSVEFAGKAGDQFTSLNPNSRVGVIDFSTVANEAIPPTSDKAEFQTEIKKLKNKYQNGITRTEQALEKAMEIFKRIQNDFTKKLLVVVTDGQTTPLNGVQGVELLKMPVNNLRASDVIIVAVGVTKLVNDVELNFMASEPDEKHVFHIDNYDQLLGEVGAISQVACSTNGSASIPVQPTPPPGSPSIPVQPPASVAPGPTKSTNKRNGAGKKCNINYQKIGCFKDKMKTPRPMPELILTDRDPKHRSSSGISVGWGDWDNYLADLTCRCAEKAVEEKYTHFGLQHYGECWSGPKVADTYFNDGKDPRSCIAYNYEHCPENPTASSQECMGKDKANYVYAILPEPISLQMCPVRFTKVGCFKDKGGASRPLPVLLITDRDTTSKSYSGLQVDWGNWDNYLEDVTCRCAQAAKRGSYTHFGIQYFGECWSGINGAQTFNKDGQSKKCITTDFQKCSPSSKRSCVGDAYTNYVYTVSD